MKNIYIYIAAVLFLTACCGENNYNYSWSIRNNTDDTVTLILIGENTFDLEDDTIIVVPHRGWILHNMLENTSLDMNCVSIFDELELETMVSGNKMLTININDESNWDNSTFQDGCNNYNNDCRLIISAEDLREIE